MLFLRHSVVLVMLPLELSTLTVTQFSLSLQKVNFFKNLAAELLKSNALSNQLHQALNGPKSHFQCASK